VRSSSVMYQLGQAVKRQARLWYGQQKFEEARSAALHAADVYKRVGATEAVEGCRALLQAIEQAMERQV
jgi:hypothetical protein